MPPVRSLQGAELLSLVVRGNEALVLVQEGSSSPESGAFTVSLPD